MMYRKKPLIVEAWQWWPQLPGAPGVRHIKANRVDLSKTRGILVDRPERYVVDTQHGEAQVEAGDWIIKGINGEYYPCKPDVFAELYEPAHRTPDPVDDSKATLGPILKDWLQKTSVWGKMVREQEATLSKRFLLNMMLELTELANAVLVAGERVVKEKEAGE